MASKVDWDSLASQDKGSGSSSGKGRNKFMKFEAGHTYNVRPVGSPRQFYKFFHENRSVCVNVENVDKAAAMLSEHFGQEIKPQLRFVINVIDREDNSFKVLEQGQTLFKQFAVWAKGMGIPPGGSNAADWLIQADGEKLQRKYTATPLKSTPLSEDELRRAKSDEFHDLDEMYASCPLEEIISRMTENKNEQTERPQRQQTQSRPASSRQPVNAGAAASVSSDDPTLW